MKVYCGDCKYYRDFGNDWAANYECDFVDNKYINSGAIKKFTAFKLEPEKINKNNDCKNFKPKWYKKRKYRFLKTESKSDGKLSVISESGNLSEA